MERPVVRVVVVCLLLAFVGWTLAGYAAAEGEQSRYPTNEALSSDFSAHHGEAVEVWVTVEATTTDGFRATNGCVVTGDIPATLAPGDAVQVYGVARPGPRIAAERVAVSTPANRRYMFGVSVLAIVMTVALGLRHWRPTRAGYFVPREGGDG